MDARALATLAKMAAWNVAHPDQEVSFCKKCGLYHGKDAPSPRCASSIEAGEKGL